MYTLRMPINIRASARTQFLPKYHKCFVAGQLHKTAPQSLDNLPGTEDTVIKKAVPPGGDSALHLAVLKLAIAQTG